MNANERNERPARQDALEEQGQQGRDAQQDAGSGETPIYLNSDSTLQTPDEHARDASVDPRQDNRMDVNRDDLHEVRAGRLTGRDETDSDKA